ncbi:Hydrogenobyrinate a,c-diamide synthase [Denitratisoma oestradiolicum]|uniref:Hydrogenobyrinate a,c-diamide synthase n=1 Tax=Denitratisoma oestradiolicum TaxID=311182 RepID=A0A6S6XZ52_9PROT|nr:cobyrinate a,c-diamide synthase [Denitratisoma oestradiolicum]CAB1369677.1 Hydrogenobyrinate a,c-diamide synthase [Denitratisoma oestradiolicum]
MSPAARAGTVTCPALFIAAPASGQGKTSITAALARLHARQGRRVRVFKCGPDFLDPQLHGQASGAPCHNLDLWMCGEADGARRLAEAAGAADLILVEGVMGLFDGEPSGADIAQRFGLPVLAVIDASAMAQTFAAVAHGLHSYRPGLPFHGVLANRVGSPGHGELLRRSLPADLYWCGAIARDDAAVLPERHLGLLPADEILELLPRIERLVDQLAGQPCADLPPVVNFACPEAAPLHRLLAGQRIAVARDAAFCFIYPANLDTLRELGATLSFFSPLAGDVLPDCDSVWLPGGYPELHGLCLAACGDLWRQLGNHVAAGKPLLAECGGMMALFEELVDLQGRRHAMAGLLPGVCTMQPRLAALGSQEADLPEGRLRGHAFHYSSASTDFPPLCRASRPDGGVGEAVYRRGRLTASYVHFYFAQAPEAIAGVFMP